MYKIYAVIQYRRSNCYRAHFHSILKY